MSENTSIIDRLTAHIKSECSEINQEGCYDSMLDECYSFKDVGGPFSDMLPSRVLREIDPIAYRCGMNDYFGTNEDTREIDGELYWVREVEKAREEFLDELDSDISDLDCEIDENEAEEDPNLQEIAAKKRRLAEMRSDYETAERHTF